VAPLRGRNAPSGLAAWKAAGEVEVELPSGTAVRGVLPTVGQLMLRGVFPDDLLPLVVAMRSEKGTLEAVGDPERRKDMLRYWKVHIAGFIRELREPDGTWKPTSVTVADIDLLPAADIAALWDLVARQNSPTEITARSQLARNEITWEEFEAIGKREAAATVIGWGEFRGNRGGPTNGNGSTAVADATERDAGDNGSGNRASRRSRARGARGTGDRRAARTASAG
jgi:hypothetical protein